MEAQPPRRVENGRIRKNILFTVKQRLLRGAGWVFQSFGERDRSIRTIEELMTDSLEWDDPFFLHILSVHSIHFHRNGMPIARLCQPQQLRIADIIIMSRISNSYVKPTPIATPKRKDQKPLFQEKHTKLFSGFKLPKHLEQKISLIELHQIQQAFILYHQKERLLSRTSLGPILRSLGLVISNIQINTLVEQLRVEDMLDLVQLLQIYSKVRDMKGDPQQLSEALQGLSGDRPDLDLKQLRAEMTVLGDPLTEKQFDQVIRLVGSKNGRVNCDQLKQMLLSRFR